MLEAESAFEVDITFELGFTFVKCELDPKADVIAFVAEAGSEIFGLLGRGLKLELDNETGGAFELLVKPKTDSSDIKFALDTGAPEFVKTPVEGMPETDE